MTSKASRRSTQLPRQSNQRCLRNTVTISIARLAAVTTMLGIAGCTDGTDPPRPSTNTRETVPGQTRASDNGAIQVVDFGFQIKTPTDDATRVLTSRVDFGVVLQNTSVAQTAQNVQLLVRLLDAHGEVVNEAGFKGTAEGLRSVDPGERVGVADRFDGTRPELLSRPVVKMEIEIIKLEWVSHKGDTPRLTVSDVSAQKSPDGYSHVHFLVHSTDTSVFPFANAHIIYHNSAGKVVGGIRGKLKDIKPGRSEMGLEDGVPPADADIPRTEVFIRDY